MAKLLFHSCRSPSAAAAVTPRTTLLSSDQQPHVVTAPAGAACRPRGVPRRRFRYPARRGTGQSAADDGADDIPPVHGAAAYRWLKSSRWHVIEANAYATAATDGDDAPRLKIDARRRVRRRSLGRRRALHHWMAAGWSSDDGGWFSSDDEERASACGEGGAAFSTLVCTRSSSTTTTTESSSTGVNGTGAGPGANEGEKKLPVAGSVAVVKRSDDPRADFRRSMVEMVVGRGIYDADGLERLLRCFLALNDQRHRCDIVAAFGDVWEAVFANPPCDEAHDSSCGKAAANVRDP